MTCFGSYGGSDDEEQHTRDAEEACDLAEFMGLSLLDFELMFEIPQLDIEIRTPKPRGLGRGAAHKNDAEQKQLNEFFHRLLEVVKKSRCP